MGLLREDLSPEYEPYDTPHTPRLSYGQLQRYVGCLPTPALEKLALGPSEGGCVECGVCWVLEDLLPADPSESPEEMGEVTFSAYVLQNWHDSLSFSERYNEVFKTRVIHPGTAEFIEQEAHQVLGSLMYARCCAIYFAAILALRGGAPVEGGE